MADSLSNTPEYTMYSANIQITSRECFCLRCGMEAHVRENTKEAEEGAKGRERVGRGRKLGASFRKKEEKEDAKAEMWDKE